MWLPSYTCWVQGFCSLQSLFCCQWRLFLNRDTYSHERKGGIRLEVQARLSFRPGDRSMNNTCKWKAYIGHSPQNMSCRLCVHIHFLTWRSENGYIKWQNVIHKVILLGCLSISWCISCVCSLHTQQWFYSSISSLCVFHCFITSLCLCHFDLFLYCEKLYKVSECYKNMVTFASASVNVCNSVAVAVLWVIVYADVTMLRCSQWQC